MWSVRWTNPAPTGTEKPCTHRNTDAVPRVGSPPASEAIPLDAATTGSVATPESSHDLEAGPILSTVPRAHRTHDLSAKP